MGSWVGYTVYPADGVSPSELQELLRSEFDDSRIEEFLQDDPRWGPSIISETRWSIPGIVEQGGAIGQRVSPQGDPRILEDVIVNWLERYVEHIIIVFIVICNNTSDEGRLSAYRVEDGQLQQVRSEMFKYKHDSEKGSRPEQGARLYWHDYHTMETDRTVDYLSEFEEEFGYRPILFYA